MHNVAATVERIAQICATLVGAVFLLSGVAYLYLGRVTVTAGDFWWIYDFCLNHTWLESALLKHNGHSLFFPSFIWLADLRFFHGDQQLLFFVGLALLFITASLLLIPVWRDKTVSLTAKILSTLVVIVGNFWMARANITSSGGLNCINSSAMTGVALAFLFLPKTPRHWATMTVTLCAGFLASFSFGTGLAIWPTLLFLAWCLRLQWRSVALLCLGALATVVIYGLLPPHFKGYLVFQAVLHSLGTAVVVPLTPLTQLCKLVGSPIFHAAAAWYGGKALRNSDQSFTLALWCGVAGLALTGVAVIPRMIRRDIGKSGLEITGLGLMIFNVLALILVVSGRNEYFRLLPFEVLGPRYLFWSSLFWTGLLLVGIERAEHLRWGRWNILLLVFAIAVFAWPAHYQVWFSSKYAQFEYEKSATTLINGVADAPQSIGGIGPLDLKRILAQVARLARQLRARRLDMFADGLQDWIGISEADLFSGRHRLEGLQGRCTVDALLECDNGAPAARVRGQASKHGQLVPRTLVIIGPTGTVCGVARSAPISPLINRMFYLGKFTPFIGFLGYIRDYNPQLKYVVRSADDRTLSEEKISVQVPIGK
jgi:hypothetical protein